MHPFYKCIRTKYSRNHSVEGRADEAGYDRNREADRSVSVNVVNQPLQEALIQMVKGSDVSYQISGSNIVLKKKPIQKPVTVSGTVLDQNKQPIVGASVIVKGTAVGTSTGADGSFSLQVPPPHRNSPTGN